MWLEQKGKIGRMMTVLSWLVLYWSCSWLNKLVFFFYVALSSGDCFVRLCCHVCYRTTFKRCWHFPVCSFSLATTVLLSEAAWNSIVYDSRLGRLQLSRSGRGIEPELHSEGGKGDWSCYAFDSAGTAGTWTPHSTSVPPPQSSEAQWRGHSPGMKIKCKGGHR